MAPRSPRLSRRPSRPRGGAQRPPAAGVSRAKMFGLAIAVVGCMALLTRDQHQIDSNQDLSHSDLALLRGSVVQPTSSDSGAAVIPSSGPEPTTRTQVTREAPTPTIPLPVLSPTTAAPPIAQTETPSAASTGARATSFVPAPPPVPTGTLNAAPTSAPTTAPPTEPPRPTDCYHERDVGIIERVASSLTVFSDTATGDEGDATTSPRTQIAQMQVLGGLRMALLENVIVDLTKSVIHRPIKSMAQDGSAHDPRFRFTNQTIYCANEAYRAFASTSLAANDQRAWNLWERAFAYKSPKDELDASLMCDGATSRQFGDWVTSRQSLAEIPGNVVLLARRDDHNPFFQVSAALNMWITLQALKWDPTTTTLVHLDSGYPSPIDELHHKLIAPAKEIIQGPQLVGKRLLFSGKLLLAPAESTGPMMQHLNDAEPCFSSELFRSFRRQSLLALNAKPTAARDRIVVTIISRRPYNGRMVQRRWLNEDEIVEKLRAQYVDFGGTPITFQSVDFVDVSIAGQMQTMLDSDVVIGMHGAGMVNVLWTRPGTLVIEIFPAKRERWGFRNLCQFVGCEWHQFRGGEDVPLGNEKNVNAFDKNITFAEWSAFFDPLFHAQLDKICDNSWPIAGATS